MQQGKSIDRIKVQELNPHEEIIEENLKKILTSLKIEKQLREPVIIDENTKVILDGHHRVKAFKILGIRTIPCRLVNYRSEKIKLRPNKNEEISKDQVIEKGLSNEVFPPKTTNHSLTKN